jgi:hypothetical protein
MLGKNLQATQERNRQFRLLQGAVVWQRSERYASGPTNEFGQGIERPLTLLDGGWQLFRVIEQGLDFLREFNGSERLQKKHIA